jgi:hypothetical protein
MKTFCKVEGRLIYYETGVVAPDGYREITSDWLCWRCDSVAEYGGFCEKHYSDFLEEQAEDELEQKLEYQEGSD